MAPTIFLAKNYLSRQDCEAHIVSLIGSDIEKNKAASHEIKGTKNELAILQLDDKTSIFGVKCTMLYDSTEKQLKEKLSRTGGQWK